LYISNLFCIFVLLLMVNNIKILNQMAHNLETSFDKNGKLTASFVSVLERPWHTLGKVVDKAMTSTECIQLANMDFLVGKTPCIVNVAGEAITSEDQCAVIRLDKTGKDAILGYVNTKYEIFQNSEAFEFMDDIVGADFACYETAGVLGKGERIFITLTLPEHLSIEVSKGDKIRPYLLVTSSHDGKGGVKVALTYTRVVCNNTLNIALGEAKTAGNVVTKRHTKNLQENLKTVAQILGITDRYKEDLETILPKLAQREVTETEWLSIVGTAFFGKKEQLAAYLNGIRDDKKVPVQLVNTMDAVKHYDNVNPTQANLGLTAWGAYNAVTGYFQNVESKDDVQSGAKFTSVLDGRIAKASQLAWDKAYSFLN